METKQKSHKIGDQSKKIKKPIGNKFGALVQDKVSKKARVLDDRKSLIQEYRQSKNKNEVQDKRFLRKREPESKLIQTLERKRNKKSIFNLDSDNEDTGDNGDDIKLTHKGVDVDLLNDYKEDEFDKEASDDENINARLVNDFHFEGFEEEGHKNAVSFQERKKTKQEIYKELIHKSKKEKFLRQQAAVELQEKVQELDDGFGDIVSLLMKNPDQYKDYKKNMSKNDAYLALTSQLQSDRRIKPEAENTVDPNREDKKKKRRRRGDGPVEQEVEDDDSNYGDDVDIVGKKKKNRKMKDAVKKQEKTAQLMGFLDEIKAAKKADSDEDNDLDDVDLDDDDEDDDELDGEDDDDDDDLEGLDDDEDLDDDDEY